MLVANMDLHGGLSKVFHEEMTKASLNVGSIVIIVYITYYDDESIGDVVLVWIMEEINLNCSI